MTPPITLHPPPEGSNQGREIKALPSEPLLKILPMILMHIKAETHLRVFCMRLNELSIHCMEQSKSQNSIQQVIGISAKISTLLMNSENIKSFDAHRIGFNLTDKVDIQKVNRFAL